MTTIQAFNESNLNIVKTDQSFVHIKHSITIRQYKFWHLILTSFSEQLENGVEPDRDGFYYQSFSEVADRLGYEVARSVLKSDFEALRVEPLIVNYLEKDGLPAEHFMGFVSEYKISSKRIGFRLPSIIEKIIKNKEEHQQMFLLLNWNIFNSFSGKYEAIIYKLCKDYIGIGRTPNFSIEKYREYMGVLDGEYKEFKELNRWVIKKPLVEIQKSEFCDIEISVEYEKKGRAVIGLYFKVKPINCNTLALPEVVCDAAFKGALISIPLKDQKKYLAEFDREIIQASIDRANIYIEELKSKDKEVKFGAIYHKAISENWGVVQIEENLLKEQEKQEEIRKANLAKQEQIAKEQEALALLEYDEKLLSDFLSLSDEIKESLILDMIDSFKKVKKIHTLMSELYNEYGFDAYSKSGVFKGNLVAAIKKDLMPNDEKVNGELFQ